MWPSIQRWRGVILIGAATATIVWLALSGQLVLYIHPRYVVFTVIMAVITLVFVTASTLSRSASDHGEDDAPAGRWPQIISATGLVVAGATVVAMLVLPPAVLTSATADQRDINSTTISGVEQDLEQVSAGDADSFAALTVVDWASLLRQTNDLGFYADKTATITGFITPDAEDPDNVFYVSRFFITCCAVDAQPAGVPVYLPGWSDTMKVDDWVEVTGEFATNPSSLSAQPLAIDPSEVTVVEQPSEPYLY